MKDDHGDDKDSNRNHDGVLRKPANPSVCEKQSPFLRAFALEPTTKRTLDLELSMLMLPNILLFGRGVYFFRRPGPPLPRTVARKRLTQVDTSQALTQTDGVHCLYLA